MKKTKKWLVCITMLLLCIVYILLVKTFDVRQIGPQNTSVGMSHLNQAFLQRIEMNLYWYRVTELLGVFALLLVAIFGIMGLYQWIRRKHLLLVDRELLLLGGLYLVVLLLYVVFEKISINYRPVLLPEEIEPQPSFPSSHTLLSMVVFGSLIIVLPNYITNSGILFFTRALLFILLAITIIGRMLSGVHWITDIAGGLLIGETMLTAFYCLYIDSPAQDI